MDSTTTGALLAPIAMALPDAPAGEPFTALQWSILMAIMDGFIPSIRRSTAATTKEGPCLVISDSQYNTAVEELKKAVVKVPDAEPFDEYLAEMPSAIPEFQSLVKRFLSSYIPEAARKKIGTVLSVLR
jgi:hypothetical protein